MNSLLTFTVMAFIIGTNTPFCGHTWISRSADGAKVYALRSLGEGSSLLVYDASKILAGGADAVLPDAALPCIGQYRTPGKHSCHITLLGRQAVLADYTSGTLSLFDLDAEGMPCAQVRVLDFPYRKDRVEYNPSRQASGHVHSSWLSPDGENLVVVDLGNDCLYRFKVRDGKLDAEGFETLTLPDGCGPRHCAFGEERLYVATELSDEVLVYSWPEMKLLQRVPANPAKPGGGSHIVLSPDGRYLYVSLRLGNDGIAIFAVGEDGMLTRAGYLTTGAHPRHFSISNDGNTLAVACRDSDIIEVFTVDKESGALSKSSGIKVKKPVYVDFK